MFLSIIESKLEYSKSLLIIKHSESKIERETRNTEKH